MVRPITKTVSMEVPDADIDEEIKKLRDAISEKVELKALERLYFIKMRRAGIDMDTAVGIAGISKPTGYSVQDDWNESGLESIRPKYAGGAPRRLSDEQIEVVKTELEKRGTMSTPEVREFIKEEFEVTYTPKQIAVRLRSIGAHYAKPYPKDYRSPDDADDILKKTSAKRWSL